MDFLVIVSVIILITTIFSWARLVLSEIRLHFMNDEDAHYYWTRRSLWRYRPKEQEDKGK
jgi:hypothetical protein